MDLAVIRVEKLSRLCVGDWLNAVAEVIAPLPPDAQARWRTILARQLARILPARPDGMTQAQREASYAEQLIVIVHGARQRWVTWKAVHAPELKPVEVKR